MEVILIHECNDWLVRFTWEHLDIKLVLADWLDLFNLNLRHIVQLHGGTVRLTNEDINAILGFTINILDDGLFEHIVRRILISNNFLDPAAQELVITQLILFLLLLYYLKRTLGLFHVRLGRVVSILGVFSLFDDFLAFFTRCLISHLFDHLQLFRALLNSVCDLT